MWEPRATHFSYIVLWLLQTVNATKDAESIVALGQLRVRGVTGGRALGQRQSKEERGSLT